jgi:hypothetical protein
MFGEKMNGNAARIILAVAATVVLSMYISCGGNSSHKATGTASTSDMSTGTSPTGTGTDTGADTGTGTDSSTGTATGTDTGTASGTGTDTGSDTGTGTSSGTGGLDLNGIWDFTFFNVPIIGTYGPIQGDLTHSGSSIQVVFPSAGPTTYNGTVSGTSVTFVDVVISAFTVDMAGTATNTQMTGTWSSPPYGGTWSAEKR